MAVAPPVRKNTTLVALAFYLITLPFLILVSVGNTSFSSILQDIYFFKLDVSNIIPIKVENSQLLNSVARSKSTPKPKLHPKACKERGLPYPRPGSS